MEECTGAISRNPPYEGVGIHCTDFFFALEASCRDDRLRAKGLCFSS